MAQALAEALQTPIEVIWPPEDNAHVDVALRALREQRAHEAAEAALPDPTPTPVMWAPAPEAFASRSDRPVYSRTVPDPRDILATLDGHDLPAKSQRRRLAPPLRVALPAVVAVVGALAGGVALATAGDDGPTGTVAAAKVQPSDAERERQTVQLQMNRARERGDFDEALRLAEALRDRTAAADIRALAGGVLVRRAWSAVERGDLVLANSRVSKAEDRYGATTAVAPVVRRIAGIRKERSKRVAARRAKAKRDAQRAREAAAAQVAVPAAASRSDGAGSDTSTQSSTSPSSSSSSSATSPSVAPSPGRGASGAGGTVSSGGSAEAEFGIGG